MTEINDHEERVKEMAEALNMIPMSVIEDIKAEISDIIENDNDVYSWYNGLYKALEIIDKHISRKDQE